MRTEKDIREMLVYVKEQFEATSDSIKLHPLDGAYHLILAKLAIEHELLTWILEESESE
jgi:hypothetical protein